MTRLQLTVDGFYIDITYTFSATKDGIREGWRATPVIPRELDEIQLVSLQNALTRAQSLLTSLNAYPPVVLLENDDPRFEVKISFKDFSAAGFLTRPERTLSCWVRAPGETAAKKRAIGFLSSQEMGEEVELMGGEVPFSGIWPVDGTYISYSSCGIVSVEMAEG